MGNYIHCFVCGVKLYRRLRYDMEDYIHPYDSRGPDYLYMLYFQCWHKQSLLGIISGEHINGY